MFFLMFFSWPKQAALRLSWLKIVPGREPAVKSRRERQRLLSKNFTRKWGVWGRSAYPSNCSEQSHVPGFFFRHRTKKIRDWRDNNDVLNRMRGEIDDIFYEKAAQMGFDLPLELQDKLIDECIEIAIANED
jgi:hypothetical protein